MKQIINLTLITTASLLFTACTSSTPPTPIIPNTPSFNQGKQDGCITATGDYTKNSDAFKMDTDYKEGWYYGRKNCNTAQAN